MARSKGGTFTLQRCKRPDQMFGGATCLPPANRSSYPFLHPSAAVHECFRQNETHGGVAVIQDFLMDDESTFFSGLVDFGSRPAYRRSNYSTILVYIPPRPSEHSEQARRAFERFRAIPGIPFGLKKPERGLERLKLSAGGNHTVVGPHHDRGTCDQMQMTVIVYLPNLVPATQLLGGQTIFPLLGVPPSASSTAPGELARRAIARNWRRVVQEYRRGSSKELHLAGHMKEALTLCAAVAHAAQAGTRPPCFFVNPVPGSAVLFSHWGKHQERVREEWTNLHLGCPVLNGGGRLSLQIFRRFHVAEDGEPSWSSLDITREVNTNPGLVL